MIHLLHPQFNFFSFFNRFLAGTLITVVSLNLVQQSEKKFEGFENKIDDKVSNVDHIEIGTKSSCSSVALFFFKVDVLQSNYKKMSQHVTVLLNASPPIPNNPPTKWLSQKLKERSLYSLLQWNDYRKENFVSLIGIYDSKEWARKIQHNLCHKVRNESHWMNNNPIESEGDNLCIVNGDEGEPETIVFQIEKHEPMMVMITNKKPMVLYALIHTFWGGWGGSNICCVQEVRNYRETYQHLELEKNNTGEKYKDVYFVKEALLNHTYDPVMW